MYSSVRKRIPEPSEAKTGRTRVIAGGEFGHPMVLQRQREPSVKDN
jgi:hypothetical protein